MEEEKEKPMSKRQEDYKLDGSADAPRHNVPPNVGHNQSTQQLTAPHPTMAMDSLPVGSRNRRGDERRDKST